MSPAPPDRPRSAAGLSLAIVTDAIHPYHRGGKESRYAELLPRIAASAKVTVYTMHWWPERSHTRTEGGVEYRAICPLFPLYNDVRRSILEAVVFALACVRLITQHFDVIEADHMPYLHLFTLRAIALIKRRPLVVTWNEVWGPDYWREYLGPRAGRVAWWIERAAMELPDTILAVSTTTADRLRAYLGERAKIAVVENGLNLELIKGTVRAETDPGPDLLYVGRLLQHKGVDLLLHAMTILRRDHSLDLIVVGNGPALGELQQQVEDAGLSDRVRFRTDVADQSEVFRLMKSARIFVFPSLREGFGIAPLEALACGARVITTNHPDNHARHLVGRSSRGILCEPSPEGVAAAIEKALLDDAKSDPLGLEEWIEQFDWAAISEQYLAMVGAARQGARSTRPVARRTPTWGGVTTGQATDWTSEPAPGASH